MPKVSFYMSVLFFVFPVTSRLLTDLQQTDANVFEHATVWILNQVPPEAAVELAVIFDTDFAVRNRLAEALDDFLSTHPDPDTQNTFFSWIEDVKYHSALSKSIFLAKTEILSPAVTKTFRQALKTFYRSDISQTEINDFYRALYNTLNVDMQKEIDKLYYQVYERSSFHFVTPNVDYDRYLLAMQSMESSKRR